MATFQPVARSHLSPDGGSLPRTPPTAWQPMATIQPVTRSHLSPDGGSLTRAAQPPLGIRWLPFGIERDQTICKVIRLESIERD